MMLSYGKLEELMYHQVPIYQFPYITAANSYIGHPGCPKLYGHPGAHVVAAKVHVVSQQFAAVK